MKFFVTGGAGFIRSAVVRKLVQETSHEVVCIDKLTYAGNLDSLSSVVSSDNYYFERGDICNREFLEKVFEQHQPDLIMHLAAESHVDRSIDGPSEFIQTNLVGTFLLLDVARNYFASLEKKRASNFVFHHVSTDEVYGDLGATDPKFLESTPYAPSSPYSASKAGSDHLVRAWGRTYDLPIVISNCSNNYGPFHFPEKLIPHMILNALHGKHLPVYGDGQQIRDWLFVDDHADALIKVAVDGRRGETYNIGGHNEVANIDVVRTICDLLTELKVAKPADVEDFSDLILFVDDRPGHDQRYAINASKIANELGWVPKETFETGLRKTVQWYIDNPEWWQKLLSSDYQLERLGKG